MKNVQAIQERNDIDAITELKGMNFSAEMETGTGKTYVYLRTIYELNQQYGFKKLSLPQKVPFCQNLPCRLIFEPSLTAG
ncbi:MAG: DEAD/DEAH box helicase family protein [Cryomorphaceae bacterium]|nr:DEAD/DEAH box helicase family protein [Cryomorphaceae bacterium]